MHRRPVRALLDRYELKWPRERELVARFREFCDGHADCLERSCAPGHFTASAWILDARGEQALLHHHKKLGKWLQLGGHVDGAPEVESACLREAQEESGMIDFVFVPWAGDDLTPLDLDVHEIPARPGEAAHLHWDVRFLLQAGAGQGLRRSSESNELAWVTNSALRSFTGEESVLRMARKACEVTA